VALYFSRVQLDFSGLESYFPRFGEDFPRIWKLPETFRTFPESFRKEPEGVWKLPESFWKLPETAWKLPEALGNLAEGVQTTSQGVPRTLQRCRRTFQRCRNLPERFQETFEASGKLPEAFRTLPETFSRPGASRGLYSPPVNPAPSARPRALLAVLALALALWAFVCLPTLLGRRTFFLRDVFTTHLILKAFGAHELAAGRIPAVNPAWGLGQPFRGNPNALPYYPGNLFYLALPFWSAFNLHYALHWLLALFAMAALARGLGQGREAALLAGITYAGSGWFLSALSFYNLVTVAAWWPLVLLGAVLGGRRGIALGGLACGLALLGGEPVAAALGLVPLGLAAVSRHGLRRGIMTAAAIVVLGVALALPQLVALREVLASTVRGGLGMTARQAADYALHPARLIELFLPFPFGRPTWIGPSGVWAVAVLPAVPLFLSLYAGSVGLWLAAAAAATRRYRAWAALAAAGLALAILGGAWGPALSRLSFGLFRFPEKFLFFFALALPLLAGWGLDAVVASRGWRRVATAAGGAALLLALLLKLATPGVLSGASARLPLATRQMALSLLSTQLGAWALGLAVGGAVLLAAAWAARGGRRALVAALQLAALVQLWPLVVTDSTAPYRAPAAWARRLEATLGHPPAALNELLVTPHWQPEPAYSFPPGPHFVAERIKTADLGPAPGLLHGLTYPLAPDLEGMQTLSLYALLAPLPHRGWPERALWMRLTGVDAAVLFEEPGVPDLALVDRAERYGVESRLYAVRDPAPLAWSPRRLLVAANPAAAREAVVAAGMAGDPLETAIVPRSVPQGAGRVLAVTSREPDRIEFDVEGAGGIVAVRRAFLPLYRAEAEGKALVTMPLDLALLGVAVPPGRHHVVLTISACREEIAMVIALLALLGMLWLYLSIGRRIGDLERNPSIPLLRQTL